MEFHKQVLAFDYKIRFRWDSEELKNSVDLVVLPNWDECEGEPNVEFDLRKTDEGVCVFQNGDLVWERIELRRLTEVLRRRCYVHLGSHSPGWVFVHSGVLDTPEGLILLPGGPLTGKSTLLEALLKTKDNTFYSDEYAAIDEQGYVWPFPRPLSTRLPDGFRTYRPAAELGWNKDCTPKQARYIVFAKHKEGASWNPQPMTQGDAVFKLLQHTVSAKLDPVRSLSHLKELVATAESLESDRGEAEEVASIWREGVASQAAP